MKKQTSSKTIETLAVLALFFLTLFIFFSVKWASYAAFFLLVLSLFKNPLAEAICVFWLSLSETLGKISTFLILSLVFYAVITPLAFLWRAFNKKEASHFLKNEKSSFFEDAKRVFSKAYFEKTW